MHEDGPFSLAETARRVRAYRVVEAALFELLGAWVRTARHPEVKLCLFDHAARHGDHARLWEELVPVVGPPPLPAPAEAPEARLAPFLAALAEPGEGDDDGDGRATVEALAAVYEVAVSALVAAYAEHLAAASDVSDGPLVRALTLVLRDEREGEAEGRALVARLVRSEALPAVESRRARVERLLSAVGGVVGPAGDGAGP